MTIIEEETVYCCVVSSSSSTTKQILVQIPENIAFSIFLKKVSSAFAGSHTIYFRSKEPD